MQRYPLGPTLAAYCGTPQLYCPRIGTASAPVPKWSRDPRGG